MSDHAAINDSFLKSSIRTIPDWPQPGVQFRDVTALFECPKATRIMVDSFVHRYIDSDMSHIAAMDARGFLIGSTLAYLLHKPLVMFRKKGKLPGKTMSQDYELEYGKSTLEVHAGALSQGDRVLLIDDLIATGGTLLAANKLIKKSGACTIEAAAIVDLPDLGGSTKLQAAGLPVFTLCTFEGE